MRYEIKGYERGRRRVLIIMDRDVLLQEIADTAWVQAEAEHKRPEGVKEPTTQEFVDLTQEQNMRETYRQLVYAQGEAEDKLYSLLFQGGVREHMSMDNDRVKKSEYVTELLVPTNMREGTFSWLVNIMSEYMRYHVLAYWAQNTMPAFAPIWEQRKANAAAQLERVHEHRNQGRTVRAMEAF